MSGSRKRWTRHARVLLVDVANDLALHLLSESVLRLGVLLAEAVDRRVGDLDFVELGE